MYILISVFLVSFLGTAGMVLYKMMSLRMQDTAPAPVGSGSLEHHFGAFLRTTAKRWMEKVHLWIKNVFAPAVARGIKDLAILLVRLFKSLKDAISRRIDSRVSDGTSKKGAASFFLKDIAEHKKNVNGKEV